MAQSKEEYGSHPKQADLDIEQDMTDAEVIQYSSHGHVQRRLKSRQVQFMAIGGTIGTGLFIGMGSALTRAGPLSMLLGYSLTGVGVFAMMQSLGEMVALLPLPGAIPQYGARFVDEAMGFALGWNVSSPAAPHVFEKTDIRGRTELVLWIFGCLYRYFCRRRGNPVFQYWTTSVNPAAWISILVAILTSLNIFAVEIFGEVEFVFAAIKVFAMVGLLILCFIIDLGGGPNHKRLGFHYWKEPGAMKEYLEVGDLGRFLGFFSTLITASFSYGGIEAIAVIAGEAENPRRNMPKAINRLFWRIIIFYVLGSLAIGVLVPYNDATLLKAQETGAPGAAASPWVIAIQNAGISGLPSVINAVILLSAASASNQFVYVSSRYLRVIYASPYLYALAKLKQAPRFFLHCNKRGVPYYCVGVTCLMMALTYLSVTAKGTDVFTWLSNITITSGFVTWGAISFCYLRFYSALKAQGIDRRTLPYRSRFQPYLAWGSFIFFVIVGLGCGFSVFINGNWSVAGFLTYYINIPIFFVMWLGWKIFKRTKFQRAKEIDLFTGRREIDAEDAERVEEKPKTRLGKFWAWLV